MSDIHEKDHCPVCLSAQLRDSERKQLFYKGLVDSQREQIARLNSELAAERNRNKADQHLGTNQWQKDHWGI